MGALMTQDEDVAVREAWKHYAEACLEHDCSAGKHACEDLARLVPIQRQDS